MLIFNLKRIPVSKLQPIPAVNSCNVTTYPMTETFTIFVTFLTICVCNKLILLHVYAYMRQQFKKPTCHWAPTCPDTSALPCSAAIFGNVFSAPSCVFCVCSPCRLVWAPCPLRRTAASWRPPGSDQSRTARACGRYQPVVDTNVHTQKSHMHIWT